MQMKKLLVCWVVGLLVSGCGGQSPRQSGSEWQLSNFTKIDSLNPILKPTPTVAFGCPLSGVAVKWAERNVLNPAAVVKNGQVHLFVRAQDLNGTSRIGIATSTDGLHFRLNPTPVLYPANDSLKRYEWNAQRQLKGASGSEKLFDGVEDPRIVETEDGRYLMTYTAYDGKTARLCLATSRDLLHWQKHGLVLHNDKYRNTWSKSGAIVAKRVGNRIVAARLKGKYWMYFGDTNIFVASSDDLLHWQVAENAESGQMIAALYPRAGYFDSRLVEPGPYALLSEGGILLIYNGSNAANFNDPSLPKFTYAAGQALFDSTQPHKLIDRSEGYFIKPDKNYERVGEVNEVCFVEGLVFFQNKWFLYYGTADSKVAVAVR